MSASPKKKQTAPKAKTSLPATGNQAKKVKRKTTVGSLLAPTAMGGLIAGKGFDFQTRYAVCHLPEWLEEGSFHQFMFEGVGDIDIRFVENGKSTRIHIQVKDHDVGLAEFAEVLRAFRDADAGMPGTYKRFVLACPSLSGNLPAVESGLARYRNAAPFYDDDPNALQPTKADIIVRLKAAGVEAFADFVLEKVSFDIGHGDMHHHDRAGDRFVGRLLKLPDFAQMIQAMVAPVYPALIDYISARKGKAIERAEFEKVLREKIAAFPGKQEGSVIWVHNWTQESFEMPADFLLDWSADFDRSTRRVPKPAEWSDRLIPELADLKKKLVTKGPGRLIQFRGKCALSTGVALGATFPTVGGWKFELPQPPDPDLWRSDVPPTSDYKLSVETTAGDQTSDDIVVGLNVRGDGRREIADYINSTGIPPRMFAFMSPPGQGSSSIKGAADARAFAIAVREELGRLQKIEGVRKARLFVYGPFALAIFLGQELTSVGQIQLFEYQDPGYTPSCLLKT